MSKITQQSWAFSYPCLLVSNRLRVFPKEEQFLKAWGRAGFSQRRRWWKAEGLFLSRVLAVAPGPAPCAFHALGGHLGPEAAPRNLRAAGREIQV